MKKFFLLCLFFCIIISCVEDDLEEISRYEINQKEIKITYNPLDYVEVCGVKWAKGNLQYCKGKTDDGFFEGWSLAEDQWEYFNKIDGKIESSFYQCVDSIDHFNWGVCGTNSLTNGKLYPVARQLDLTSKLYKDRYCKEETENFSEALFGDIAHWASKGQWRLPNEDEILKLFEEASYYPAFYEYNNKRIFGFYFYTPIGERFVSKETKQISDEELDQGLFLPCAGLREKQVDEVVRAGIGGFYWHGKQNSTNVAGIVTLRFLYNSIYWSPIGTTYGRSIRPIFNENKY